MTMTERMNINIGDRIELIFWKDSMAKAETGTQGLVVDIDKEQGLIWVKWDTGERLALLSGIDRFRKVEK